MEKISHPFPQVIREAAEYPGIDPDDQITREIRKPNGDKTTLFASGAVVIHLAGKMPRTRTPDGRYWLSVDGVVIDSTSKRKLPLEQRPLNVASNAVEKIGQKLSNFEERRFASHGKNYHSIEAWYQGLKWPKEQKRAEIAKLSGPLAKRAGKGAPSSEGFTYQGREYGFGSAEHHQLIKAAIRASLEQNPKILKPFLATHPRPLEHHTGRKENPSTALPGSRFTQLLEEIRREMISEKI